ncbi:MAG: hypothetical protein PHH37_05685 [Paludibacter sp.]|nr:hypothetical protein [Paludibacter sp.]MDD3078577.1 hypothetical protein [Paludibacter sp.]
MKHIIFSIFICLFLASCVEWTRKQTDYHYIINQSNKEIVHILYSDHELVADSFVSQIHENSDTTLEWEVSEVVGVGEVVREFDYNSFYIFNLTDTSSFHWEGVFGRHEYNTVVFSDFFSKSSVSTLSNNKLRETNWITKYYLTVNDTLLSLMTKDYSMLERFKEYYQK